MVAAVLNPGFDAHGSSVGIQFLIIAAGVYWVPRLRKRLGLPEEEPSRSPRAERWTYIVVGAVIVVLLGLVTWLWGPEFPLTLITALVAATTIGVGLQLLKKPAPGEAPAPEEAQ
jgi:hypothetical protein